MPWAHARTWHKALWALHDLAETSDRLILTQRDLISDQSEEIDRLRRRIDELSRIDDAKNFTIYAVTKERDELLQSGDDVAENYRKHWVKENGPTTPPSVTYWQSVKERHAR